MYVDIDGGDRYAWGGGLYGAAGVHGIGYCCSAVPPVLDCRLFIAAPGGEGVDQI